VQTNRSGYNKKSVGAVNISESIGTVETADLLLGLTRTEELDAAGCIQVEILEKNRYSGVTNQKCVARIDRPRMRLYDADPDVEQSYLTPEAPVRTNPTRDEVVRLRDAGNSLSEIAAQLNLPESTVKSHLRRAREHAGKHSLQLIAGGRPAADEPELPSTEAPGDPPAPDSGVLPQTIAEDSAPPGEPIGPDTRPAA
jgi:DNA-binding CsgD family transcriptional regulator